MYDIRKDLFSSIMSKDVEFFDKNRTGDLMSRLSSDIQTIQSGLSDNFQMIFRTSVFIVAQFVNLFLVSWKLCLILIGTIFPFFVFSYFYGKAIKKIQKV